MCTSDKYAFMYQLSLILFLIADDLSLVSHSKSNTVKDVDMYAPAFIVTPMQQDINPGQTVNFAVNFYPLQSNRNYVSDLEAMVFFKNQRTFRLVNDATMTPPWCVTVRGKRLSSTLYNSFLLHIVMLHQVVAIPLQPASLWQIALSLVLPLGEGNWSSLVLTLEMPCSKL